jgi:hypothetical protein
MVARGNVEDRHRRLAEQLEGLDPRVLAVYERMHARELAYRDQVVKRYPALRVNQLPDRCHRRIGTAVVRRWLRERQIFAFIHQRHFWFPAFQFAAGEPKPVVYEVLHRIQPLNGWQAMFWFVGANGWLEAGAPVDLIDSDPVAVVLAASHANDLMSD